jgi:hypothetical protein
VVYFRLDIKKVKGKRYIQLVDQANNVFHIGATTDWDSWLIAAIVWSNEWKNEYYRERNAFFDQLELNIEACVGFDEERRGLFSIIRYEPVPNSWKPKRLHVPKKQPLGELLQNDNIKQRYFRPMKWCPNEWGQSLQKRLDEISSKQRLLIDHFEPEPPLEQSRNIALSKEEKKKVMYSFNTIIHIVQKIEERNGSARWDEVIALAGTNGIRAELTAQIIRQLLREGSIYEPGDGLLKKV